MKAINTFTKNLIGCSIITLIAIYSFGAYGIFAILPVLFFAYWIFSFKKSMKWHVRSFKSTASMYSTCGFEDLVSVHESNINQNIVIGEYYKIK